jgi:GT2 family glycosyltransferase
MVKEPILIKKLNYIAFENNEFFHFDIFENKVKELYYFPFVNAAAWFIPKHTLNKVGGFDPIFFHYGKEENYCQR